MKNYNGYIITLSGISGAGKSHFIKSLIDRCESFEKLKAVTTRAKRKDEIEGVDKFFLTLEDFKEKEANDQMRIVNNVFGNMYGYYKDDLEKTKDGINLVTELYYKEVSNFKKEYPNTISVYILPSDISKTIDELNARNTGYEELQKRLSDIRSEVDFFTSSKDSDFDIIVTNDYDLNSIEKFIEKVMYAINDKTNGSLLSLTAKVADSISEENKVLADKYSVNKECKPIIYTSFDGDDMHYLHDICLYEINRGNIPLNPETSLGYYVSTICLGGKKKEVMKDCLTLEMIADKMSVYSKENRPLSEGILAEMILWDINKHKGLDRIEGITHLEDDPIVQNLSPEDLKKYLSEEDNVVKYELSSNLLQEYNSEKHQSAYIIANMDNFKHIDWARAYCYSNHICPISPQNILPLYFYKNNKKDYIESRLELLKRADRILLFLDRYNMKEDILKLDEYSLVELYYLQKYLPYKKIELVGWDEALVPKYDPNSKWALTTKEDIQVRKMVKKMIK